MITVMLRGDRLLFNADDFHSGVYEIEVLNEDLVRSTCKWINQ